MFRPARSRSRERPRLGTSAIVWRIALCALVLVFIDMKRRGYPVSLRGLLAWWAWRP